MRASCDSRIPARLLLVSWPRNSSSFIALFLYLSTIILVGRDAYVSAAAVVNGAASASAPLTPPTLSPTSDLHMMSKAPPRLGDTEVSQESYADLFSSIDENHNGNLSLEEIKKFISDAEGSALEDEISISEAVNNVMVAMDSNHDNQLKAEDLSKFWVSQASMLSIDEVAAWLEHSLHMPAEVCDIFRSNAITGFDFPELLEHNGRLIGTELGITKRNLKMRIYRGILMRLMGMGTVPSRPIDVTSEVITCNDIKIHWGHQTRAEHGFPVHKYVLQRLDGTAWTTVLADNSHEHFDLQLQPGTVYSYRLCAWNAIGRSEYVYFQNTTLAQCSFLVHPLSEGGIVTAYPVADAVSSMSASIVPLDKAAAGGADAASIESMYRTPSPLAAYAPVRPSGLKRAAVVVSSVSYVTMKVIFMFFLVIGILVALERLLLVTMKLSSPGAGPHGAVTDTRAEDPYLKLFGIDTPVRMELIISAHNFINNHIILRLFDLVVAFLPASMRGAVNTITAAVNDAKSNPTGEIRTPERPIRSLPTGLGRAVGVVPDPLPPLVLGDACHVCQRGASIKRVLHFCGQCSRMFCKRHSGHIDHPFFLSCKVPSRCRCQECKPRATVAEAPRK